MDEAADDGPVDDGLLMRDAQDWARFKLDVIACYLPAFSQACATAGQHYVVDAFAGPGVNRFDNGELRWGTPLLALRTSPPITRVLAVEPDPSARAALRRRTEGFGSRAIVCEGDANRDLLSLMRVHLEDWAPALAVFDPEGTELEFATVAAVSEWRAVKTKAELLILLATHTGFLRMLWEELPDWAEDRMDRLYGTTAWREIHRARRTGKISTDEATSRYVRLYADQLRGLGYEHVLDREIRMGGREGRLGYFLLFASQHPAGKDIMQHCFDDRFGEEQQPPLFRYRRSRLDE